MTVGITELPPEGMQLGGVALAGDTERGTKTTEGLSLLFTTAGITVQGPQPQIERLLVWSGLDSATCREKVVLPDGRNAAVMELTSGGQSIRFLFPTESVTPGQAAYLDQALPHWLARYKGAPPSPVMANGYGSDSGNGNGQDGAWARRRCDLQRRAAATPAGWNRRRTATDDPGRRCRGRRGRSRCRGRSGGRTILRSGRDRPVPGRTRGVPRRGSAFRSYGAAPAAAARLGGSSRSSRCVG